MPNAIGDILTDLLRVFHETCEEEGVPYVLWGETARAIALLGEIPEGFVKTEVAVPAWLCEKLVESLNSIDPDRYTCEYWGNNPCLPFLTVRLHNKKTTYFNFKQMDSFTGFGIRLEILPLRSPGMCKSDRIKKEKIRCSLLLPHTHFSRCECNDDLLNVDECISDADQFFAPVVQGESFPSRYVVWHPEKKVRKLSSKFLMDTVDIRVSGKTGLTLRVPRDFDSYMEKVSKRFWRDRKFSKPANSQRVWVSAELPYQIAKRAFDRANFPLEEFASNRAEYDQAKKEADHLFSQLGVARATVRAVHNEISAETFYDDKKQKEIVDQFVAGDWEKLRSSLAPYRQWMLENVNGKVDYAISLSTAAQVVFISMLKHDGDDYAALRAWHCLARCCERRDLAKICSALGCEEWS